MPQPSHSKTWRLQRGTRHARILAGEFEVCTFIEGTAIPPCYASRDVDVEPFAGTQSGHRPRLLWDLKRHRRSDRMGQALSQPDAWPSEIEIRPLFEAADFGDALTPELPITQDRREAASFLTAEMRS